MDYEQMEIDITLESDRDLKENMQATAKFALGQIMEYQHPTKVKNRHEGYGIAAEGYIVEAAMVYNFRENAGNQTDTMIQMSEVADIVGNLPIYDTIYKENRYSPWKYAGQCYPGELQNRNPALMPMCYICSRYRADTREELEENIRVAKWAANKVVSEGKIPIAPHLYFPRFMDDSIAEERYFGMEAGKRLMMQCKEFLVVTVDNVISEGMNEEIDYMTNKLMMQGKSINFTRLGLEQVILSRLER